MKARNLSDQRSVDNFDYDFRAFRLRARLIRTSADHAIAKIRTEAPSLAATTLRSYRGFLVRALRSGHLRNGIVSWDAAVEAHLHDKRMTVGTRHLARAALVRALAALKDQEHLLGRLYKTPSRARFFRR